MSEKLTIKQMISVAIKKELPVPDEASGLVEYHSYGFIDNNDELLDKRAGTSPTDKHMELINSFSRDPQEKDGWEVYSEIDPVGPISEIDSHGDVFDKAAIRDMVKGAPGSPVLTDHNHELGSQPPMGVCIAASMTKDGSLKETWAFPKEDYNSGIRMGLSKGLIRNVSVGIFVSPRDKICNTCGDKSIYSMECSHYPGDKDNTSVTIKRVKRYAERSLVNIPARLGTSTKSLAPEEIDKSLGTVTGSIPDSLEPLFTTSTEEPTLSGEISFTFTKEMVAKALKEALEDNFSDDGATESEDQGSVATIPPVISEDIVVMSEKDVKAPEAQEPSETEEIVTPEAPAPEDTTEAPEPAEEIKSVEVPVIKSLEVEELTKSFTESVKTDLEAVNKTVAEANEAIKSFKELQDGQGAQLKTLIENVSALAEQIAKLAEFSTEEAITKLLEVAGQIKEQAPAPKSLEPKSVQDVIDMLRK